MAIVAGLLPAAAAAAPEEIQVYMDEMNRPGQFGLDVHTNYVATGQLIDDYAGQQQSRHRLRITPELSLGLSPSFELGLYLPLADLDARGHFAADGVKVRLKYLAPRSSDEGWFWGANFEIGRVAYRLDQNPYNAEFKAIAGRHRGPWTLAFNGNIAFKIDGPASAPAAGEVDTKLSYALGKTLAVGIESYNGVGEFRRFGRFGSSEQATFLVLDKKRGNWDFNLGVGSGYGANRDRLTVKLIIGVPID